MIPPPAWGENVKTSDVSGYFLLVKMYSWDFPRKLITFWGGVNTQRTLPFGSPDEVRDEVRGRVHMLVQHGANPSVGRGGGYVLSPDHSLLPDVPSENIVALYEEACHVSTA